jgi:hypothetical protein
MNSTVSGSSGGLLKETLIGFAAAARRLPALRGDRPVNPSTIFRWATAGVRSAAGIVRLEAMRLGGRWLTSVEALERFAAALTPDFSAQAPEAPRSPATRSRASAEAARELERRGC